MSYLFFLSVFGLVGLSTFAECFEAAEQSEERKVRNLQGCNIYLYNNRGVISSPNYPSNYDNNLVCTYSFVPSVSDEFRMKFYMCEFDVEYYPSCQLDYAAFDDGTKICGVKTGTSHEGSLPSGVSYIDFHSDSTVTTKGFKIAYCADCSDWSAVRALCSGPATTSLPYGGETTSAGSSGYCDVTLVDTRGVINSPNYPTDYDNDMDCRYTFMLPVSGHYSLKFYMCDFVLEENFSCEDDYIKFEDGLKICGEETGHAQTVPVTSDIAYLDFHSDSSVTKKGFKIAYCADCSDWSAVKALCVASTSTFRPREKRHYKW